MDRSPLLLAAVVSLHVFVSWRVARAWLRPGDDRAWGTVLLTLAQWGTLATMLSLARALTPGGWLAGLAVFVAGAVWVSRLRARSHPEAAAERRARGRPTLPAAGTALLALVVASAFAVQWHMPLHKGDDLMYHASRVAYWLEHRGLLPYPTHNDRQNVFPAAGDLPFLVGLLFTRDERVARVLHLGALPLALWAIVRLERALGVRGPFALAGPLLFVTTPLVVVAAEGIGAELWTAVALLGFLHCLVALVRGGSEQPGRLGWPGLGAFAAAAVAFKLTLLPLLALLPLVALSRRTPPLSRRVLSLAAGLVAGALGSGLALTVCGNLAAYGHPLGPAEMRRVHTRDPGLATLAVHAARVPFLLGGVPALWSEGSRRVVEETSARVAEALRATRPLAGEEARGWPGAFRIRVPLRDERFSLTAILGAAASLWVLARALRRWRRGRGAWSWPPLWVVFTISLLVAAIVFGLRWQTAAGLPDRFLVPLLAPAAALVGLAACALARRRVAAIALALLMVWGLVPGTVLLAGRLSRVVSEPARPPGRVGLFADAAAALPAGARVLLVSSQYAGDYVLFAPERAFPNVVLPWGQRPFDAAELQSRLARDRPTHVLIENAHVDWHWGGALDTREMAEAVAALPGVRRVPLPDRDMRLFALP